MTLKSLNNLKVQFFKWLMFLIILESIAFCKNFDLPKISTTTELLMLINCMAGQPQCSLAPTFKIKGTISGHSSGTLKIALNDTEDLSIPEGQTNFQFSTGLKYSETYSVAVTSHPSGSGCTITNGNGSIASADITDVSISCSALTVSPRYTNAKNWNDYIVNNGTGLFSATGAACTGTEPSYRGCIPGFLIKYFYIPNKTSCTNLSISDSSRMLKWTCAVVEGKAVALSYGLEDMKGLADTIDFSAGQFKELTVYIFESGKLRLQTTPQKFWANQIISVTPSCTPGGATVGTIYSVDANITCGSVLAPADHKVSVVTNPATKAKIIASATGFLNTNLKHFFWLEATIDGTPVGGGNRVIWFNNSNYSRIHNTKIAGATAGGSTAISIDTSNNNVIQNLVLSNNGTGLRILTSTNNLFFNVSISNHTIGIDGAGANVSGNIFVGINVINSAANGIDLSGATFRRNNLFIGVTSANHSLNGLLLGGVLSGGNLFSNLAFVNNGNYGINISGAMDSTSPYRHTFINTAYINNNSGIVSNGDATANPQYYFTGQFRRTAGTCLNTIATSGVTNATCSPPLGISDFTDYLIGSGFGIFKGKSSDSSNLSDDATGYSTTPASGISDWFYFDNFLSAWGMSHINPYPDLGHRGICSGASYCQIFDMSLSASNSEIRNVLPCPNGNSTKTHYWHASAQTSDYTCGQVFPGSKFFGATDCRSTFLSEAIEIFGDAVGNENGLCESNESCLYTPNIGAYQGHGTGGSASTVSGCPDIGYSGTITNVKLYQFAINGY